MVGRGSAEHAGAAGVRAQRAALWPGRTGCGGTSVQTAGPTYGSARVSATTGMSRRVFFSWSANHG